MSSSVPFLRGDLSRTIEFATAAAFDSRCCWTNILSRSISRLSISRRSFSFRSRSLSRSRSRSRSRSCCSFRSFSSRSRSRCFSRSSRSLLCRSRSLSSRSRCRSRSSASRRAVSAATLGSGLIVGGHAPPAPGGGPGGYPATPRGIALLHGSCNDPAICDPIGISRENGDSPLKGDPPYGEAYRPKGETPK